MEPIKTVVCVDTSASTSGQTAYYEKVNVLIKDAFKVVSWNSDAAEIDCEVFNKNDAGGGTYPQTFLNIIKTYNFKYRLIVTTDGQMSDSDINYCHTILDASDILNNIVDFRIYYIGHESYMNMKIDNLFTSPNFKKEIFINEHSNCCVDINIDFNKLAVSDVTESNNFKASIISLISRYPEKKLELRSQVCKLSNRLLSEMADKNVSVKEFFDKNDVSGCIEFIKGHMTTADKKKLQQKISEILNLFNSGADLYTLSHLSNTNTIQPVEIIVDSEEEDEENEDEEDDDYKTLCDILFIKCKHLCLTIRHTDESIIPDDISKQLSIHPFLLLKHEDLIKKIVDLVEFQQMDLSSYVKLENKTISPFTRQPIRGIYVFNSDSDGINYNIVRKNNNRILSVIFGNNNKLPGNKGVWNIVFLYLLMKHHPKWKSEMELIKKEIKYVTENTKSFLTLSPLLDPNIMDQLNVCLWYIVNVSHRMFPNSSKNVLREMGESSQYFLDFYSEVFNTVDEQVYKKNRSWLVWNYMVQQKSNRRKFKSELLAQYQNYIETNGTFIFLSGKCERRCESLMNILPVEKVLGLNSILHESSGKFDQIDRARDELPNITVVNIPDYNPIDHVLICLNTCQPTLICPLTNKYWKDCAGDYSVENASYFRTFKDYCFKYNKYPNDEYDLIAYHTNKHYNRCSDFIIYSLDIFKDFRGVIKKFVKIMETHSIEDYLRISNINNSEEVRQENEKLCINESCKH